MPQPGVPRGSHGWSPSPETFPCVQYGIPEACDRALNHPHGTTEEPSPSAISSRKYGQDLPLPSTWNVMQPCCPGAMAAVGQSPLAVSLMVIELEMFSGVLL